MAGTQPKIRFSKVMEILLWLAGLGVLAENIFLFRQNRDLSEALAPQITAGTQLRMLAGIAFDGRLEPVALPAAGSKLLIIAFSPGCPACQANQDGWMRLASTLEQKGVRVLWVSRDPIEITRLLREARHSSLRYVGRPALQNLCPTRARASSQHCVGGTRGQSGEGVGRTSGSGGLERDVCIFWRTGRDGFSSPSRSWRTRDRLQV
jgi:hypothetical protein